MNPSNKEVEEQKSEQSSDQSHWYSPIASSKQKIIKLMKVNMLEQMMSWFPTSESENSRLIPKVW